MAGEREKAIDKGRELQPKAPEVDGELSESATEKIVGGVGFQEIVITKPVDGTSN